jgi:transposase InsO family protein
VIRLIDEIHLRWPFYGSRRLRDELQERGHTVNRKRAQPLMRQMGLRALYPRQRTSQPGKGHKIYPYILRQPADYGTPSSESSLDACRVNGPSNAASLPLRLPPLQHQQGEFPPLPFRQ